MAAETRSSISERVLQSVYTRLASATTGNGYATDAGQRVFRARRTLAEEDLPCMVLWDGGESLPAGGAGDKVAMKIVQTVIVEAHVLCDQDETGRELGKAKADAKKAVLRNVGRFEDVLGAAVGVLAYAGAEPLPREDGAVSEAVRLTFTVTYPEAYGDPYGPV